MFVLTDLFSVADRVALVTGGATGLGRICAEALLSGGARVLIASRKADACEAAARQLSAIGPCEGFGGSVADEAGVAALANEVRARTDKLHILVNNAGVSWGAPFAAYPWKAWERVMSVNVAGLFSLTSRSCAAAICGGFARSAGDGRQCRLGDGLGHPGGKRLRLFGLEGRGSSSNPNPRR